MDEIPQPRTTGAAARSTDAAAELAEIHRRQERVIGTAIVPLWYWWSISAAIIAIGVARDTGDTVVQAVAIPVAALVIVVQIVATTPAIRRVQVATAPQDEFRAVLAIFAMIVLLDAVIIGVAAGLAAAHASHPVTIGCITGAGVLVIVGPLINRYLARRLRRKAEQHLNVPQQPRQGGA